ncbi:hypothetical protein B0J13DRAFT_673714 [Dactylonectria estremocensis]|uniref:Myb-like domain-containing protein n=1 Tax=Dactylonectria estremocensis TaxID=1079267 RepID=A0A9P9EY43_9HYPO|nr:hypothetical protein B0J13DRAFT_673714 [Dactylonectria estremocensis]
MSDTEKGEGKALPWTEEAKNQFLLRIIGQFKEDGKQINWSRVDMPGRTTKSLQNMWTKINKLVSELEEKNGAGEGTPTKKVATPRKPRAKKAKVPMDDEDCDADQMSAKKATPRKRAATGTPKRPAKVQKTEHDEDDDEISTSIKVEVAGDELESV